MTRNAQRGAAGFAAAYGTLALGWTLTGHGFPFGRDDARSGASPLRALAPEVGAPLFAAVLLGAAVVLLTMSGRAVPPRRARIALLTYAWAVGAGLLVLLPDTRLLTLAGYLPILLVGLPFGVLDHVDLATVFTWTLANQVIAVAGGLLIARATARWQFRTAGACAGCGRPAHGPDRTSPESVARWGRPVTWVAAVIPALYAVVRLAWAAGIPLGIPRAMLAELQASGAVWAGAGLGAFALAGAVLTLGLVQRWGEVFPRWMPGLAGRRVPIRLATVPATLVALFVTSAAIGFLTADGFLTMLTGGVSLATAPMLLWPVWGVALGAATLAYHLRRRPACRDCGRGDPARGLVHPATADAY